MALFSWLQRRRDATQLAKSDAIAMIARFGDDAYLAARMRAAYQSTIIDANRPPRHWSRVKAQIAKRQGIDTGLNSADRCESNARRKK